MEESTRVRDAVLGFYRGVTEKDVDRFDEIVSSHQATIVIGTAPGEWVTERPQLRFGFETEGITLEPGSRPMGYEEGTMGWFVDEPWFGFPGGGGMRTRVTGIVRQEVLFRHIGDVRTFLVLRQQVIKRLIFVRTNMLRD